VKSPEEPVLLEASARRARDSRQVAAYPGFGLSMIGGNAVLPASRRPVSEVNQMLV
jgi:hypothetical protein